MLGVKKEDVLFKKCYMFGVYRRLYSYYFIGEHGAGIGWNELCTIYIRNMENKK